MFMKIAKSVLAAVTLTILILSAVFYWTVPGYVLTVAALVALAAYAALRFTNIGIFAFLPVALVVILGFALWFPIALVGIGTGATEAFFVVGGIAAVTSLAYVWSK